MEARESFRCEECGLVFPSSNLLIKHRANFCVDSVSRQRVRELQSNTTSLINLEELKGYLAGEHNRLPKELEGLSVSELRQHVSASVKRQQAAEAEAKESSERATAQLAALRLRAEVQKSETDARIKAQRTSELQAQLQEQVVRRNYEHKQLLSSESKQEEL